MAISAHNLWGDLNYLINKVIKKKQLRWGWVFFEVVENDIYCVFLT